jgi:hypothetical protein
VQGTSERGDAGGMTMRQMQVDRTDRLIATIALVLTFVLASRGRESELKQGVPGAVDARLTRYGRANRNQRRTAGPVDG